MVLGKMRIELGDIVLAVESSDNPNSFTISLEDNYGNFIQDIAMVKETEDTERVKCLVWADPMDENYTHKFLIDRYRGE